MLIILLVLIYLLLLLIIHLLLLLEHWEIDYRKIIGIYRNFDGKLLHSSFTTVSEVFLELIAPLRPFQRANSSFAAVSEVFWELIAPNLMILLLFR